MKKSILSFILISSFSTISAQDFEYKYEDTTLNVGQQAKVNYIQDSRINDLLDKKRRLDIQDNRVSALRIQIYSGSRDGANWTESSFKKAFPNVHVEINYEQPYFKTKVSAYRNRLEAERALLKIERQFKGAFIFEEKVKLELLKK